MSLSSLQGLFIFIFFFLTNLDSHYRPLYGVVVTGMDICSNDSLHDCVDTCRGKTVHPCITCTAANGSYVCTCPPRYVGDARVSGSGCTLLREVEPHGYGDARGTKRGVILFVLLGILLILIFGLYWIRKIRHRNSVIEARIRIPVVEEEEIEATNRNLVIEGEEMEVRNINSIIEGEESLGHGLDLQELSFIDSEVPNCEIFSFNQLKLATSNFKDSEVIGSGSQGKVFKGILIDGRHVAIKQTIKVDKDIFKDLINEIRVLSQLKHDNVVKLIGYCLQPEHVFLVYQYIPNGTLSKLIHDNPCSISWKRRLQIAVDVGRAIRYLHSLVPKSVLHRDIKSDNVLMDEAHKAILGDFGIARLLDSNKTHLTTTVMGTNGYLDLELLETQGQHTDKSDVYSFGVLLAELVTGKKAIFYDVSKQDLTCLSNYFTMAVDQGNLFDILHTQVVNDCQKKDDLEAVAALVSKCLKCTGKERPTMAQVVDDLEALLT
ncbi:hypothetical protein L1049_021113 [Liquidambar formosana]|uniref:Protein kinase domain-containing protein n=1 Tax=Liquidambar formosana TaxID=63359 RepID=A0AAP0SA59_LIQFO